MLSSIMLASCQDKLHESYEPTDGLLRFAVNDSVQWQQGQVASSESRFGGDTSVAAKAIKVNGTVEAGRQMYLVASVKEGIDATNSAFKESSDVATKGTMITGSDAASFHQSFGVLAQSYSGTAPTTFTPNYMDRVQVSRPANGNAYSADNKYYIPKNQTVKMFAYAPYEATTLAVSHTDSNDGGLQIATQSGGRPSYNFRTPKWMGDQDDICFAEATATRDNSQVQLNFQHAMAAVRFMVSSTVPNCTIKEISVSNIKTTATLTPGATAWWTNLANPQTFTYDRNGQYISHTTGQMTPVFGDNNAMFMIPQDLQSVTVTITVIDEHDAETVLTASITDRNWARGNTYTYTLSFDLVGDQTFEVTPTSFTATSTTASVPYTGGDFSFSVTSAYDDKFIPYKIQYKNGQNWTDLDVTNQATMFSEETTNAPTTTTTTTTTTYSHTLSTPEAFTISSTNTNTLKGRSAPTGNSKTNPKGLANGNTANCYVVGAPGWYTIPLVFGNGLLNGSKNTNSKLWDRYVDAYGNTITQPYIYAAASIGSARVLWQDVEGLVRDVEVYGTEYLRFNVQQSTIAEGNAVIGCFDTNGKCIWSWHIWVTPIDINSATNRTYATSEWGSGGFLNVPIGFVQGGTTTWESGSVTIRFIPKDPQSTDQSPTYVEALAKEFTLTKNPPSGNVNPQTPGRYPTYQWGRKDPMRPLTATPIGGSTDCPVYPGPGGNRDYLPTNATMNDGVMQWIQNPHKFHTNTSGGIVRKAFLWNAFVSSANDVEYTSAYTAKSLYDPCPYGYSVPPGGAYNDFVISYVGGVPSQYFTSPAPSASNGTGGSGQSLNSFDMPNKTYGNANGYGFGYAYFNVFSISNTPNATTMRVPLLGARVYADNFSNTRYGDRGFYWMAGKPSTTAHDGSAAHCLGIYLPQSGTPWIDVLGFSNYASFDLQDLRNAYAIMPYTGAELD